MAENLQKSPAWRAASSLVIVVVVACAPAATQRASVGHVSTVSTHAPRDLVENSAAAMSARQPGVFFTINDSGNEPILFAMDTSGADRGSWRVLDSRNTDWESAAIGPCAPAGAPECVYIGDTGDNNEVRRSREIYRVAEPSVLAAGARETVSAERLSYQYADGPHDVEAMVVARDGDVFLITKRPLFNGARRLRPSLVFRLPADAWARTERVVAELVDSLPIVPGETPLTLVTDASLSPDSRFLAVRTYTQVFIFATDSVTARVDHGRAPRVCDLEVLGERQGEGMTWVNAGGRLLFTSEGAAAPLHLADCPVRAP